MPMVIHAPITLAELWDTLKQTRATTLGPDDMSNTYLKKLWDILGPIILDAGNLVLAPMYCCHHTNAQFRD